MVYFNKKSFSSIPSLTIVLVKQQNNIDWILKSRKDI